MSVEYPLININQIDLDALADYLIAKNKLVYRNDVSDDKAQDVDKVAGADSRYVAVAVSPENRETVKNALMLGGLAADEYMTTTTGATLSKAQAKLKNISAEEVADLKDEVYQLKAELLKKGIIEDYGNYAGFTDPFRRKEYINIQDAVGTATTVGVKADNEVIVTEQETFDAFEVYDFVSVYNTRTEFFNIREIVNKDTTRKVLVLNSAIDKNCVAGEALKLFKSQGIIHEAQYKFAKDAKTSMGSEQFYNGLTDDEFIKSHRIQAPNQGYGWSFRVPSEEQGYVTGFKIGAKVVGNPGSLICYLFDSRDIDKFHNPTQFEGQYAKDIANENIDGIKFFAKSQPLQWLESEGKRYKYFNFQREDGTYPLMSRDVAGESPIRYIAVIECTDADTSNYYDIIFIQHKDSTGSLGDLELNNITYYYYRQSDNSDTLALSTDDNISKYDLYHQIVTRAVNDKEPEAQRQGLYTAHYHVDNLKYPAVKARLMLRIKREGMYKAVIDDTKWLDNIGAVRLTNEDKNNAINTVNRLNLKSETIKRYELRTNANDISEKTLAVIGNNICKVSGFSSDTVNLEDSVLVRSDDKIYRMNYLVSLKARIVDFNKATGELSVSDYDHYVLPLKEVFKDFNPSSRKFSDRLIFECDFTKTDDDGYLIPYNDFEFQIFWENQNLPLPTDAEPIEPDYMAAIKDLVFSLDKGF